MTTCIYSGTEEILTASKFLRLWGYKHLYAGFMWKDVFKCLVLVAKGQTEGSYG